jgi:hypothetical protein
MERSSDPIAGARPFVSEPQTPPIPDSVMAFAAIDMKPAVWFDRV